MLFFTRLTAARVRAWTLLALLSAPSLFSASVPLVIDGRPNAMVVLGDKVQRNDNAVTLLVSHVRQMSGASLAVMEPAAATQLRIAGGRVQDSSRNNSADTLILIGESSLTRALGITLEGIGLGGIVVQTSGNALVLMGTPEGVRGSKQDGVNARAVVHFLESLGCRSLWPGSVGKVVPRKSTLTAANLNVRYTPQVAQRKIRMMPRAQDRGGSFESGLNSLGFTEADYAVHIKKAMGDDSLPAWGAWNGLGGDIGIAGGHAGNGLGRDGWKDHGKAHPDWFAQQTNGSRDQSKAGDRWRICESNPALREHVANSILKRLNGKATTPISLSPNDGGNSSFCMCAGCKALDPANAPKIKFRVFKKVGEPQRKEIDYPSLTDRHLNYWNDITRRVTKQVPDQLFIVDAYSVYSDPPVREQPHPNLIVRYVPNDTKPWEGWKAAGVKRIYWRPNNLHGSYSDGYVRPTARQTAHNIAYFAKGGMLAVDMQGIYNNWATQGLEYYVAARVSWNPTLTFEAVLDDYSRHGFGAGAEHIKNYWLQVERGVQIRLVDRPDMSRLTFPSIQPGAIDRMRASLTAAAKATSNDPAANHRVAFLRAGLEFMAISAEAHRLKEAVEAGGKFDAAAVNAVMERRWQTMRAIFQNHLLAVNVAVVTSKDAPLNTPLQWKGPSTLAKSGRLQLPAHDDWLYEDQSALRRTTN